MASGRSGGWYCFFSVFLIYQHHKHSCTCVICADEDVNDGDQRAEDIWYPARVCCTVGPQTQGTQQALDHQKSKSSIQNNTIVHVSFYPLFLYIFRPR